MNCPICNISLLLAEKQGVDIDYCQQCRSIWVKKNKTEKIIGKISSSSISFHGGYISDSYHYDKHNGNNYQNRHRRKKVLFDFFD